MSFWTRSTLDSSGSGEAARIGAVRNRVVDVVRGHRRWAVPHSCLMADAAAAEEIEPLFRAAGRVAVRDAASHRMDPEVPLLISEINADHLAMVQVQRRRYGGTLLIAELLHSRGCPRTSPGGRRADQTRGCSSGPDQGCVPLGPSMTAYACAVTQAQPSAQ